MKRTLRHHGRSNNDERFLKARVLFGVIGIAMILLPAIATLISGKLHYPNSWGAAVFAPFGIAIGILALVFAIRGFPKSRKP